MNIVVVIITLLHSAAFISCIRNKATDRGRLVYLTILVTFLPVAWIFNAGLAGAIPMYCFLYFSASILSLSRVYRKFFIGYMVMLSLLMLAIQDFFPHIIVPYMSEKIQLFDLETTFIQVILTTICMTLTYTYINDDNQKNLLRQKRRLERSYSQLSKAKEIAEKATVAKSNFIANISHEIRTPLNAIVGIADLLHISDLNKEQGILVESLQSSSNILADLVNDLLDLSKIEAQKLTLKYENVNLSKTIKEVTDLIQIQIKDKDILLKTNISDTLPENVIIDRIKYKQILINLLSNAVKFTENGQISCNVTYDKSKHLLHTKVQDTGIGIHAENIENLFTAFVQLNTHNNIINNGVGLGLTISKKMIELMKGKIKVTSQFGVGSTFDFSIPIQCSNTEELVEKSTEPILKTEKQLNVLIAEDNKINQIVLGKMLESLEHHYDVANNGEEAFNLSVKNNYDLILMDIQMPIKNGIEASKDILDHFNSIERKPPLLVACSANVVQLKEDEFLKDHMDNFLNKPVSLHELKKVLNIE